MSTTTDTPPTKVEKVEKATSYFVYAVDPDTGVLTPIGEPLEAVPAANDMTAIRRTIGDRTGSFVAIPARSVNYRTRQIETVPKDTWT